MITENVRCKRVVNVERRNSVKAEKAMYYTTKREKRKREAIYFYR
jgi:hypothetical protein